MTHLLLRFILILSLIRLICCQPHFISSLTQRNASTQVLVQSCEQALNMSSDQVMISLFLPFFFFLIFVCVGVYVHYQPWKCVSVCLS